MRRTPTALQLQVADERHDEFAAGVKEAIYNDQGRPEQQGNPSMNGAKAAAFQLPECCTGAICKSNQTSHLKCPGGPTG
jgi:hypothetical protein